MSESKLSSVLPNNSVIDSMPGEPSSTVYASNANLNKVLELVQYNNDIEMSFPNGKFSATNTFRFPRAYQFLKNIIMKVDIFHEAANTATIVEDYLAYHMIKEIKWQLGGAEQATIAGESFMHIIMNQCETQEKKDKLLDLAGAAQVATENQSIRGKTISYYAMLPFPWSSVETKKFGCMQYPLPLHLLGETLEIQITFRNQSECVGAGASISAASLSFEYAKIASPNQLKSTVYKYPWKSPFSFKYNVDATLGEKVSLSLSSFRKAELVGLCFHYVPNADAVRLYSGAKIKDIQLEFNGQIIYKAPTNDLYELIYGKTENKLGERKFGILGTDNTTLESFRADQLLSTAVTNDSSVVGTGYKIYTRGNANAITDIVSPFREKYYYYIPLTELKDFSQNYSLGVDISKQSLTLKFTRSILAPYDGPQTGTVYMTYIYNSLYQFNGDNVVLVM